jgi:hypothetical protein
MASAKHKILKVREWLKFKKPDYEGFVEHVRIWDQEGIPYGAADLIRLAKNYGTPVPYMKNGELVIDINISDLFDKHESDKDNIQGVQSLRS